MGLWKLKHYKQGAWKTESFTQSVFKTLALKTWSLEHEALFIRKLICAHLLILLLINEKKHNKKNFVQTYRKNGVLRQSLDKVILEKTK